MALLLVFVKSDFVGWLAIVFQFQPTFVLFWKIIRWPAALVTLSHSVIYYCGLNFEGATLGLAYSRFGIWYVCMASGLERSGF